MNNPNIELAVRLTGHPNHHIWSNHGTWFFHGTVYPTPVTKERVRFSFKTHDLAEARRRRDRVLSRGRRGIPLAFAA